MKEEVIKLNQLREEIKKTEDELMDLEKKITDRKVELSSDKLFNELNDKYMDVHEKNVAAITEFSKLNDEFITKYGATNE